MQLIPSEFKVGTIKSSFELAKGMWISKRKHTANVESMDVFGSVVLENIWLSTLIRGKITKAC